MSKTRTPNSKAGVTLDTGALIALDRGERRMITLLDQALTARKVFRIPAGVVGQAWRRPHPVNIGALSESTRGRDCAA